MLGNFSKIILARQKQSLSTKNSRGTYLVLGCKVLGVNDCLTSSWHRAYQSVDGQHKNLIPFRMQLGELLIAIIGKASLQRLPEIELGSPWR
uniref:Uncharacterized protein n=1 Tax=Caenorhabditis japonica TaxID=281687 RepID=A0A8R1IKX6_CAEJA